MSSGGYTTEQCCLRMVAGERKCSQFPVSKLHSQMSEIWEANEHFLQVSLTIMSSSILFSIQSEWSSLTITGNFSEIVWRYFISPCYFIFLFPFFLFQKYDDFSKATVTVYQSSTQTVPWTPRSSALVSAAFTVKRGWKIDEIVHLCFSSKQGTLTW